MIKAVLFDLDGLLLDTAEGSIESFSFACKQMGFPKLSYEEMKAVVGPPIQISFQDLCHCSAEEAQKATKIFREYYKTEALFKAYPYDGMIPTLRYLKEKGYQIGVATYKREDYAIKLLEHFGISEFCDVIHGADAECLRTKKDIVNLCVNELNSQRDEIVLIGDTYHDAEGALQAGILFIGATYGYGFQTPEDIAKYNNIGFIEQPNKLLDLL